MNNLNLSSIRPNVSQNAMSFKAKKMPLDKTMMQGYCTTIPETLRLIHLGDKLGAMKKMLSESIRIIFECMSNFPIMKK